MTERHQATWNLVLPSIVCKKCIIALYLKLYNFGETMDKLRKYLNKALDPKIEYGEGLLEFESLKKLFDAWF